MPLRLLVAVLLAAALLAAAAPALAQPDVRADGFTRLYGAVRADPSAPPGEADYLALLSRAELGLRADYDRGGLRLRLRADYDALAPYSDQDAGADVPGDGRLDLRLIEAYADVFVGKVDLRVGRQVLAWGETDGAFITDLLAPLDLTRFLAQDPADLRLGLTAVRATAYLGRLTADVVLVPRAAPSLLPARRSPWDPIPADVAGVPVELEAPALPSPTLGHGEAALRLTWSGIERTDLALIFFTGHNRLPAFDKRLRASFAQGVRAVLTPVYRRRQVAGLTAETARLEPFVLRAEAAYTSADLFDEALDLPDPITPAALFDQDLAAAAGRGFLLAKPTVQAALGAERFFGKHLVRLTGTRARDPGVGPAGGRAPVHAVRHRALRRALPPRDGAAPRPRARRHQGRLLAQPERRLHRERRPRAHARRPHLRRLRRRRQRHGALGRVVVLLRPLRPERPRISPAPIRLLTALPYRLVLAQ